MRNCVDEFWLVADGRVSNYDGDLEDYQKLLTRKETTNETTEDNASKTTTNPKEQRRLAAARRQQLSPIKNRLQKLEQQMDKLRIELASIDGQLGDPQIYQDTNRTNLQKLLQQQVSYRKDLVDTEEQWLELQEQLEVLEQEI